MYTTEKDFAPFTARVLNFSLPRWKLLPPTKTVKTTRTNSPTYINLVAPYIRRTGLRTVELLERQCNCVVVDASPVNLSPFQISSRRWFIVSSSSVLNAIQRVDGSTDRCTCRKVHRQKRDSNTSALRQEIHANVLDSLDLSMQKALHAPFQASHGRN